jgi:phospholipid-translocating ATPase
MVFKKLSLNETLYTTDDMDELRKGILRAAKKFKGPLADLHDPELSKKKAKRRQEFLQRDLATALILCNNVTPVLDDGVRVLQASSPDEIALVKFAEELGFTLK